MAGLPALNREGDAEWVPANSRKVSRSTRQPGSHEYLTSKTTHSRFRNDPATERHFYFLNPIAFLRGDWDDIDLSVAPLERLEVIGSAGEIHFVGDNDPRAFAQCGVVEVKFLAQSLQVG